MKRVAIIDDTEMDRFNLSVLLRHCQDVELVGQAMDLHGGVELIRQERPDIIFLDVELRQNTGFDLLQKLDYAPHVIFVTAFSHYAIRAFEVNAVDYLLKPIELERLRLALTRIPELAADSPLPTPTEKARADEQVFLRDGKRQLFVPIAKIAAITGAGDCTDVHLVQEVSITVRRRMKEWITFLPEELFLAVDRSLIINRHLLVSVERDSRSQGRIFLREIATPFPIGRAGLDRLRDCNLS